jgi:hypothetical protein
MSLGNQILGWGTAAALVAGLLKYARDYQQIGKPSPNRPKPFSSPEMIAIRTEVEARMTALDIPTSNTQAQSSQLIL